METQASNSLSRPITGLNYLSLSQLKLEHHGTSKFPPLEHQPIGLKARGDNHDVSINIHN